MAEISHQKMGRPSLGTTKKVSVTLKDDEWKQLDSLQKELSCKTRSELMRKVLRNVIHCGFQEYFE